MDHKVLFLIAAILMNVMSATGQSDYYDFPIRPGTTEWKKLQTYADRLNAYNIPEDVLRKMSTKGLVKTCLEYPEFRLIMTRNDLQTGYFYIRSIFNGFRELEKRADAGRELLEMYKKLNIHEISSFPTPLEKGRFSFSFTYLEVLLAQKPILATMQSAEKRELARYCINIFEAKQHIREFNYMFNLQNTAWVLSRLLDLEQYPAFLEKKNPTLERFLAISEATERSILTDIVAISKQYQND